MMDFIKAKEILAARAKTRDELGEACSIGRNLIDTALVKTVRMTAKGVPEYEHGILRETVAAEGTEHYYCPECGDSLDEIWDYEFPCCPYCGQAISWDIRDFEEEE